MRISHLLLLDVGWTLVAGAVMAVSVIPINVIALGIWLSLLIVRYRRRGRASVIITQCGVLALLLVAATLAPVKIAQHILDRPVVLDAKRMSLQQLADYVRSPIHRYRNVPIWAWLIFAEEDKEKVVEWPSKQMTLAEFIAAIESQTPLRHQFHGCGNGWTLLWGNDCCFGLSLSDPELRARPRKRYEAKW
jgi:hypothetical protein